MARLNDVGFRISRTAAQQCPATAAGTGITLDYIGAYAAADRAAVSELLGLADAPQVAAVAKGSPADTAGVQPGDAVLAINGVNTAKLLASSPIPQLFADELEQRLADALPNVPVTLLLERAGTRLDVRFNPLPVCAGRFVIKVQSTISAYTDGHNIAMTSGLIDFTGSDDELALVAGHETGHIINRDGDGANRAERRTMEDRADAVSIQLVKCAGYDLETAFQYRLRRAATQPLEFLHHGDHRASRARVAHMRTLAPSVICPLSP